MAQPDEPRQLRVDIAVVVRPHGVRGALKVLLHNPDTTLLHAGARFELRGHEVTVALVKPLSDPRFRIVEIAGLTDRDEAEALRGEALSVEREALPPLDDGEYYHVDLLGLKVLTPEGEPLGVVRQIMQAGHDVLVIETPEGGELLIPVNDSFVTELRPETGRLVARRPEWV